MCGIDWSELARLANTLKSPQAGPDSVSDEEWRTIDQALDTLHQQGDWSGLVRLRLLFLDICARDTFTGSALVRRLETSAIQAARELNDKEHLAMFLGDQGHNFHRQGFHQQAIESFDASSLYYAELGNHTFVLRNYHMTALCYRALHQWERAYAITRKVLDQVPQDDPWRGNPLQVLAWLYRDQAKWMEAEECLRDALQCHERALNSDILMAGTLADLGEILGLQGRIEEARAAFTDSLAVLARHKGQYARQEARTKQKFAEMLSWQGNYALALQLLKEADELCCMYGHYYDELWKIEMAMADIFLRQGKFVQAVGKMMSVLNLRQELGLSQWGFVRQVLVRVTKRLLTKVKQSMSPANRL